MEEDSMLTTYDNPFNPFKDFILWWKMDVLILGHDCCGLLARESNTSSVASEAANDQLVVDAMNRIVANEPTIYKIVYERDYDT